MKNCFKVVSNLSQIGFKVVSAYGTGKSVKSSAGERLSVENCFKVVTKWFQSCHSVVSKLSQSGLKLVSA